MFSGWENWLDGVSDSNKVNVDKANAAYEKMQDAESKMSTAFDKSIERYATEKSSFEEQGYGIAPTALKDTEHVKKVNENVTDVLSYIINKSGDKSAITYTINDGPADISSGISTGNVNLNANMSYDSENNIIKLYGNGTGNNASDRHEMSIDLNKIPVTDRRNLVNNLLQNYPESAGLLSEAWKMEYAKNNNNIVLEDPQYDPQNVKIGNKLATYNSVYVNDSTAKLKIEVEGHDVTKGLVAYKNISKLSIPMTVSDGTVQNVNAVELLMSNRESNTDFSISDLKDNVISPVDRLILISFNSSLKMVGEGNNKEAKVDMGVFANDINKLISEGALKDKFDITTQHTDVTPASMHGYNKETFETIVTADENVIF